MTGKSDADKISMRSDSLHESAMQTPRDGMPPMSRRVSSEDRQSELVILINDCLQVLKSQKWSELIDSDKNLILGLFGVIGDW